MARHGRDGRLARINRLEDDALYSVTRSLELRRKRPVLHKSRRHQLAVTRLDERKPAVVERRARRCYFGREWQVVDAVLEVAPARSEVVVTRQIVSHKRVANTECR